MSTSEIIKNRVLTYQKDPFTINQVVLDMLEEISNEEQLLLDPTNPFVTSLAMSCSLASAAFVKDDVNARKLYARMAQTYSDLYNHMSDIDYINRFSIPCENATLQLILPINEVVEAAVLDPLTGNKKLVIGGDSEWEVNGVKFYQHYPVVILVQPSGSYQVYFDVSNESPLKPNFSNIIDWNLTRLEDILSMNISIPVSQLEKVSEEHIVTSTTSFSVSIPYTDDFYYARAYMKNVAGNWVEIKTTHSGQVYDPTTPTLVLTVEDGFLTAKLPEIYLSNNLVGDAIKLDIFTTQGYIDLDLKTFTAEAFSVAWRNDTGVDVQYTSQMDKISTYLIFSTTHAKGGKDGVSFDQLRNNVIYGADDQRAPVQYSELETALTSIGYRVAPLINHVLGRVFLTARNTEAVGEGVYSRMTTSLETFILDTQRNDIASSVTIEGDRSIIRPRALIRRTSSEITILPDTELTAIGQMEVEARIAYLNGTDHFFSPYFIVLDETANTFDVRSYYLDSPALKRRSFVNSNSGLGFVVNTASMTITRVSDGFDVRVTAEVPDGMQDIFMDLAFIDSETGERWYIEPVAGDVLSTEAVFEFSVLSNFDIKANNTIKVSNLTNAQGSASDIYIDLSSEIDIVYTFEDSTKITTSFDDHIPDALHDEPASGITLENGTIVFGEQLSRLHNEGRAIQTPNLYELWPADVPMTYETDVYAKDEYGNIIFEDDGNGGVDFTIEHNEGDLVAKNTLVVRTQTDIGETIIPVDGDGANDGDISGVDTGAKIWIAGNMYTVEDITDDPVNATITVSPALLTQVEVSDVITEPYLLHAAGDVKYTDGEPTLVEPSRIEREITAPLFNALFLFSDTEYVIDYTKQIPLDVINYINELDVEIAKTLIERTELPFAPTNTTKIARVLKSDGSVTDMETSLEFSIRIIMTNDGYRQEAARDQAKQSCLEILSGLLAKREINTSAIYKELMNNVSEDVINVDINVFLPTGGYAKLINANDEFSLKPRLVLRSNGEIDVEDAVTFYFDRRSDE